MADVPAEQLGTWTFDGEPDHTVTPLAAIRAAYGDRLHIGYNPVAAYSREKVTAAKLAAFTAQAASYDAILLFVGEEAILSGEAHCLADLNLQGSQSELIAAARRSGKPVVTVVMAGRPLTIARDLANTDALLYSFHPGTMGGPALIDLIFGNAVPSGKLPVTFPVATGQIPIYYARNMTGRPAAGNELLLDEIPVGPDKPRSDAPPTTSTPASGRSSPSGSDSPTRPSNMPTCSSTRRPTCRPRPSAPRAA